MRHRRHRFTLSVAVAGNAAMASAAFAADYSWKGSGTAVWSAPANWTTLTVPPSAPGTVLIFGSASATPPYTAHNDLPGTFTANSLQFGTGAISVTGNPLRLAAAGTGGTASLRGSSSSSSSAAVSNPLELAADTTVSGGWITLAGVVSGAGRLTANDGAVRLTAANTYSGGTTVVGGTVVVAPSATLGTGPVAVGGPVQSPAGGPSIAQGKLLLHDHASVTSGDASVLVKVGGYVQFTNPSQAALDRLDPASVGVVGIGAHSAAALDFTAHPALRLGANSPGNTPGNAVTYSGTLTPANDTYRLGGQADRTHINTFDQGVFAVASLLTDSAGGAARSVNIGNNGMSLTGRIKITNPANSYSGGTVVESTSTVPSILYFDHTPAPGRTPLGTGPITVHGTLSFGRDGGVGALPNDVRLRPGSSLWFDNSLGSATPVDRWGDDKPVSLDSARVVLYIGSERTGAVHFAGRSRLVAQATTATLTASSLVRVERGVLELQCPRGTSFGTTALFKASTAAGLADPVTNMVAPYVLAMPDLQENIAPANFLTISPDGTFQPYAYAAGFNPASATEVPNLTAHTSLAADESAHAVRFNANYTLTLADGKTLSLGSGGLIMTGAHITGGTLAFGNAEAIVHTGGAIANDARISSVITGSAGLTKSGYYALALTADNAFTGGVVVNNGTLRVSSPGALNAAQPNPVTVRRFGTLDLGGFDLTVPSLTGDGTVANTGGTPRTLTVDVSADHTFAGTLTGAFRSPARLALTKSGPATLTLTGLGDYAGVTTVAAGTLVLASSAWAPVLTGAGGADLTAGRLVFDYAGAVTPRDTVVPLLAVSHASGWTAGQLRSTTADAHHGLGYLDDPATSRLTVAPTWYGDANLDGLVDADDYTLLDRGIALNLAGWQNGDFDYSGAVTPADYLLADASFVQQQQGGMPSPDFLALRESQFGAAYVVALTAAVPEPSSLTATIVAPLPLLCRVRRRGCRR